MVNRELQKRLEEERKKRGQAIRSKRKRFNLVQLRGGGGGGGTSMSLASGQNSLVNTTPINFTVTFSGPVTGFTAADVSFAGTTTSGTPAATVTGGPTTYNIAVSGVTGNGIVVVSVPAGAATITATGVLTSASNSVTCSFDTTRPSVTISAALGQADPASVPPIAFTVVFSEVVFGFLASDVVISGTSGGTKVASMSGIGPTYNIEIMGMTSSGTVVVNVPANAASDAAGNLSFAAAAPATINWTAAVAPVGLKAPLGMGLFLN